MKLTIRLFLSITICSVILNAQSQDKKYENNIYSPTIKTLKVNVDGNPQSYPAVELFSDSKILIQFDDLVPNAHNYYYRIIHCNSDWTTSDLFSDEFMDGFNENPIQNYEYSTNTRIAYINYWVSIPNDDIQLKVSGNYILEVVDDSDSKNRVLTVRFIVYEPLLNIDAEITRPLGSQIQNNSHEIKLNINHDELTIDDPFNEVKVVICQNNRPDRVIKNINPVFVRDNELVYSFSGDNVMMAGNEFRTFAFTNIHKYGINVNDIKFVDTIYHVQLRLDERRSYKKYFWEEEMNGRSIIHLDNSEDAYRTSDYAYVHFLMPIEEPILDGKVYLYGELTGWKTDETNLMTYNFDTKIYESVLLLKQGYYDYIYTVKNMYTHKLDESILEGSHYQTENDYIIYVYHRGFSQNYDRLVGYQVVNSKYQE